MPDKEDNTVDINNDLTFKQCFETYYTGLCSYAYKISGDRIISEEIVQEAYIKLWEHRINTLFSELSLRTYLYRSVHNGCINYLKHLKIRNLFNNYYSQKVKQAEENFLISQDFGLSSIIASELEAEINQAIENLPDQCKLIFKMSRFEGKKHKEIAEELKISINTIETQISRALDKLRATLGHLLTIFLLII